MQYKARCKNPYIQPKECKDKKANQTNKQTFENNH